jgi:hypothetical protein
MSKRAVAGWGRVLGAAMCMAACGQELMLPHAGGSAENAAAGAPADGFTGTAGAPDTSSYAETLPVVDLPVYTPYGGAGGESQDVGGEAGAHAEPSAEHPQGAAGSADGGAFGAGGQGSAGAPPTQPLPPPQLLFTEYVEGSGSFKALEIYALGPSSLEGCELRTFSNGKLEATRLALHGQLAAGEVYVLCTSAMATAEPTRCDRSTSLIFNGDDALALVCSEQTLDVFGQIGTDPGTSWGDGLTVDHTLRRRCSVLSGRPDGKQPFDPTAEWLTFMTDTFVDLGIRSCSAR